LQPASCSRSGLRRSPQSRRITSFFGWRERHNCLVYRVLFRSQNSLIKVTTCTATNQKTPAATKAIAIVSITAVINFNFPKRATPSAPFSEFHFVDQWRSDDGTWSNFSGGIADRYDRQFELANRPYRACALEEPLSRASPTRLNSLVVF
jgi:hypothetical protein